MTQTLTLVSNGSIDINEITAIVTPYIDIHDIQQRNARVYDIICDAHINLTKPLRETLYSARCDFALQSTQRAEKKLFVSDMDSTMVVGETIDDMAEQLGIREAISDITHQAMHGLIDFQTALTMRLGLMRGISRQSIATMAQNVNITNGADMLIDELNGRDIFSCLVSGGFTEFSEVVCTKLGMNMHHANQLSYDNSNTLNGKWEGTLVDAEYKRQLLGQLAKEQAITLAQTVAIGDGANDVLMLQDAGLGIAYYAKPAVREVVNAEIHSGGIDNVIFFL